MKTVDLEILVRPIPYTGLARNLGFVIPANGVQDNAAIACALRKVADTLDPKLSIDQAHPQPGAAVVERVVSQLREWEQAAFERSQDQTRKTEEQAYHLGKKDAYEMARLAIERAKLSIECSDPAKLRAMCVGEFKGNDSVFKPLVPKPPEKNEP